MLKDFLLRAWYLLLGALIATALTDNYRLRADHKNLTESVSKSLDVIDRSQRTSLECLNTLAQMKARLSTMTEEIKTKKVYKSSTTAELAQAHTTNDDVHK